MIGQKEALAIKDRLEALEAPVLSIYADVDPSNPDNRGGAWRTRVKNTLKECPAIRRQAEHARSLYDGVIAILNEERPESKTLVLFANQNHLGKTFVDRIDLKVPLPVIDLARGRAKAHYGEPWVEPLLFALDEYQRTAVLHIQGSEWRMFEIFLGELEEVDDVFAELDEQTWKELGEAADFIRSGRLSAEVTPDLSGSNKDHWSEKMRHWKRKLYRRLVKLVEKTLEERSVDRLVVLGERPETTMLAGFFSRRFRNSIIAVLPNPSDGNRLDRKALYDLVMPVIEEAERRSEERVLSEIKELLGVWGPERVIEALQLGQISVVVLPWETEARIWHCAQHDVYGGTREAARRYCVDPTEVKLADHIFRLADAYGAKVEFVQGRVADRLEHEFDGIAGFRRW